MVIWNALEDLRRRENRKRGYVEVKTPLLYDEETYETSGHLQNYEENIFWVHSHGEGEKRLALKPMNCPGHMLPSAASSAAIDLPLRYAESSTLHRDERGGTLHGLPRVKHITQDDAHVFVTEDQIQDEIDGMIDFVRFLYDLFGVTPAELSTRPGEGLGTDEQWDRAEAAPERALQRHGMEYVIGEGEGTFYGPKIDLHMSDSLGRSWQMGTIQLDYQMPMRFGLTTWDWTTASTTRWSSTGRCSAPSSASSASRGALRRRLPVLAGAAGADRPGRRVAPGAAARRSRPARRGRLPGGGRRARRDGRQADPGRRGREDPEAHRLRRPRVRQSLAIRDHGGAQHTAGSEEFLEELATL